MRLSTVRPVTSATSHLSSSVMVVATAMAALALGCGSSQKSNAPAPGRLDAGVTRDADASADSPSATDLAASSDGKDAAGPDGVGGGVDAALNRDGTVTLDGPQALDAAFAGADGGVPTVDVGTRDALDVPSPSSDGSVPPEVAASPAEVGQDSRKPPIDTSPWKGDLPPGAKAIPDYTVMQLSDFPYQCFVKTWDDKTYPVFYALIQSAADFDTCFGAAGVMGASKPYAPSAEDFSKFSYLMVARVVPARPVQNTFAVDALLASGGEVGLFYTFKQAGGPASSYTTDGMMVAFPKRKIDQVVIYENQSLLGRLDSADGKNDVTQNP